MKKFMKIMAFAMAMTLVFGMTVSAAESVTTEEEQANFAFAKVEAVTAAAEDGTVLEVQKAALTGEQYTAAQTFVDSATIENAASKSILAALDVSVPSVTADQLAKGVYQTTYSDGYRVIVNDTEQPFLLGEVCVPPKDVVQVRGGGSAQH